MQFAIKRVAEDEEEVMVIKKKTTIISKWQRRMWDHTTHVDIIALHNKILQQNVHLMLMIGKDENNSASRI